MKFSNLTFEEQAIIAMKRNNMTFSDIAKELDISVGYASDIIKGNRKGNIYRIKIAEILDIDLKE